MSALLDTLKETALGVLSNTAQTLSVSVKTNLGPEFPVWQGTPSEDAGGVSVPKLLGLKAAVIVRDQRGATVKTFGEYPQTEPLKVALILAGLTALLFVIIRGIAPRSR